jgi:hypothetical protein
VDFFKAQHYLPETVISRRYVFIGMVVFGQPDVVEGTVKLGILAASTSLWLINIGLPALLGMIFIFRLQFFRARV